MRTRLFLSSPQSNTTSIAEIRDRHDRAHERNQVARWIRRGCRGRFYRSRWRPDWHPSGLTLRLSNGGGTENRQSEREHETFFHEHSLQEFRPELGNDARFSNECAVAAFADTSSNPVKCDVLLLVSREVSRLKEQSQPQVDFRVRADGWSRTISARRYRRLMTPGSFTLGGRDVPVEDVAVNHPCSR